MTTFPQFPNAGVGVSGEPIRGTITLQVPATPAHAAIARSAVTRLHGWDHGMDRARAEPLLFSAWMRALAARLFADEMGPAFTTGQWPRQIRAALTDDPRWCDDTRSPAIAAK